MKFNMLVLAAALSLFASCDKLDNIIPQVQELSLNDKTSEVTIEAGKPYFIRVRVEDNKTLKFFKLEQKKGLYNENTPIKGSIDYTYSNTYEQEFNSKTETYNFTFPADKAAGAYHVLITAEDDNDNKAIPRALDFIVTSSLSPQGGPVVENTEPNGYDVFKRRGELVALSGTVMDADSITSVKIDIVNELKSLYSVTIPTDSSNYKEVDFAKLKVNNKPLQVTIPPTAENGIYKIALSVTNRKGHTFVKLYKLSIIF